MRLMVIGASGFIGAHVREQALAAGIEVVTAGRSRVAGSPGHRHADLAEDAPAAIAAMIDEVAPDTVVSCAGATTGEPGALVAANVTGVYALAKAMLIASTRPRLVHLGSAAEYGPAEPGVRVTEATAPRPGTIYGATKLAGTRLVELAAAAGLDAVVLRVFNPVGPGAPHSNLAGKLAARLHRALEQGSEIRLGPLDAVRDFIDVRDVAEAVLAAAAAPAWPHRVLNIGTGRAVQARAMVSQLVAISGYTGAVREELTGPARPTDIPWQEADITCATEDLDWKPHRDLAASLTDLWEAST